MTWTITEFPFYNEGGGTPSTVGQQGGIQTGVPADGSATVTVTFNPAFVLTTPRVTVSLSDVSATAEYMLTAQTSGESITGFTIYVAGGPAGSTCSVVWQTYGGA